MGPGDLLILGALFAINTWVAIKADGEISAFLRKHDLTQKFGDNGMSALAMLNGPAALVTLYFGLKELF
jgi:hypothetical protein